MPDVAVSAATQLTIFTIDLILYIIIFRWCCLSAFMFTIFQLEKCYIRISSPQTSFTVWQMRNINFDDKYSNKQRGVGKGLVTVNVLSFREI